MNNEQQTMNNKKGFTLIELLVVVTIIGILATTVLISLNTARIKARDVGRLADLRQIALGLEMYYDGVSPNVYPGIDNTESWSAMKDALEDGHYIVSVPQDPLYPTYYFFYYPGSNNQTYVIGVDELENPDNPALNNDVDNDDIIGVIVPANRCDGTEYCIQL